MPCGVRGHSNRRREMNIPRLLAVTAAAGGLLALVVGGNTAASTTAPRFQIYVSPPSVGNSAGEPSIGSLSKTGDAMFQSQFETLWVTFNDSTSPAQTTWTNRSA